MGGGKLKQIKKILRENLTRQNLKFDRACSALWLASKFPSITVLFSVAKFLKRNLPRKATQTRTEIHPFRASRQKMRTIAHAYAGVARRGA